MHLVFSSLATSLTFISTIACWYVEMLIFSAIQDTSHSSITNYNFKIMFFLFQTGTLSSVIAKLTSLQGLGLHKNSLSGSIPDSIGSLSSLRVLYLDQNLLTGRIPISIPSNLVDLRLRSNKLNGMIPEEVQNAKYLQVLYLDDNNITGTVPTELHGLVQLQRGFRL